MIPLFGNAEISAKAFRAESEDTTQSEDDACLKTRERPWVSQAISQRIFKGNGGRADQHSQLIVNAGKQASNGVRREFIQMRRNHPESALHARLHEVGAKDQRKQGGAEGPCRDREQRHSQRQNNGSSAAN